MTATDPPVRHVWLIRHGETEWSRSGRHTGRTDVPLTESGRAQASSLRARLAGHAFARVLTSPLSRAAETARIVGLEPAAEVDADLREWDYGAFEGRTTADIRTELPDWTIWTGPWRDGETADDVGRRADRVIARLRAPDIEGDVAVFAHGRLLRVLAARWVGLPASGGGRFELATATVSRLGWERERPTIELWNEACHLR
jgi:probable phosphoglycerate mutase